jgi:hypothetical protein
VDKPHVPHSSCTNDTRHVPHSSGTNDTRHVTHPSGTNDTRHVPHSAGTNDTRHVTHSAGTQYALEITHSVCPSICLLSSQSSLFQIIQNSQFQFFCLLASFAPVQDSCHIVISCAIVFFVCCQILRAVTRYMSLLDLSRCVTFCNV